MKFSGFYLFLCYVITFITVSRSESVPEDTSKKIKERDVKSAEGSKDELQTSDSSKNRRDAQGRGSMCSEAMENEKFVIGQLLETVKEFERYLSYKKYLAPTNDRWGGGKKDYPKDDRNKYDYNNVYDKHYPGFDQYPKQTPSYETTWKRKSSKHWNMPRKANDPSQEKPLEARRASMDMSDETQYPEEEEDWDEDGPPQQFSNRGGFGGHRWGGRPHDRPGPPDFDNRHRNPPPPFHDGGHHHQMGPQQPNRNDFMDDFDNGFNPFRFKRNSLGESKTEKKKTKNI